jgi:hypothetical protein
VNLHYDSCQFDHRRAHPVSAETKISWQDFSAMQVYTRKERGERRLPTPDWVMNDKACRQVISIFMERRAHIRHNPHLLPQERLAVAIAFVKRQRPRAQAAVQRLSEEFRQCTDKERRADLQKEIEGLDTQLRTTERNGGADFVAAIVYLYFRAGRDSVGVADALGIRPPMVRQTLWRLSKVWKAIQNPKPAQVKRLKPPKPPKVRLPKPEKPPRVPKPRVCKCDPQLAMELRAAGMTWRKVGKQLGVHEATVRAALKRHYGTRNSS